MHCHRHIGCLVKRLLDLFSIYQYVHIMISDQIMQWTRTATCLVNMTDKCRFPHTSGVIQTRELVRCYLKTVTF